MSGVTRFGVSIPDALLKKYDQLVTRKGYPNRSEALRDLIREKLVEKEWEAHEEVEVAGSLVLVYDHHTKGLTERLLTIQHQYHQIIMSTMHIHLDMDNCLEVLVIKGNNQKVRELTDQLTVVKGIKHAKLTMTTTGQNIS